MNRPQRAFTPTLESPLESRVTPSSAALLRLGSPVVTTHTYFQVLVGTDSAFQRFGNSNQGLGALRRLQTNIETQLNRLPFATLNLDPLVPFRIADLDSLPVNQVRDEVKGDIRSYLFDNIVTLHNFTWLQSSDRHSSDGDFGLRDGRVR